MSANRRGLDAPCTPRGLYYSLGRARKPRGAGYLKPATIRFIDTCLGAAACAAFSLLYRLQRALGLARIPGPETPPRRILMLKLVEQGATVLAAGAMRRTASLVGRGNVYFCCFAENRAIVDILGIIPPENVFTIRTSNFLVSVWDILGVAVRARLRKIDCTVDLEFFAKSSAVLAYLCGARRRVGMDRFTAEGPYRGSLMTHRMQYNPYLHTALTYALLVEALLRDAAEVPLCKEFPAEYAMEPMQWRPPESALAAMRECLAGAFKGEQPKRIILLNPNPRDSLFVRKWPEDRFIALAELVLESYPEAGVVFIGTPDERASTERLCQAIDSPRAATLAGQTTLVELIALFWLADALVTNDSGPAHFATLSPIQIIAMYGPETPVLFGPLGTNVQVLHHALACSPCLNVFNHRVSPCRDNVCIQRITVAEAAAAVNIALAQDVRPPVDGLPES